MTLRALQSHVVLQRITAEIGDRCVDVSFSMAPGFLNYYARPRLEAAVDSTIGRGEQTAWMRFSLGM